jgi:hypothetical protein
MTDFPFDFEFYNETELPDAALYELAFDQITDAAEGHSDITGASVSMEELSSDETPHAYQARVVLYVRPDNIAATEVMPEAQDALQASLDSAVEQVREKRNQLRNY